MKTLEEVKAHVDKVGYNQLAIQKIEGFLLGNGLLGEEFEMEYMIGERTFDDFRTWFNSKEEKKHEIDWSEFGFGDFIHVQDNIDGVLLGSAHNDKVVCFNGEQAYWFHLNDESRPCNEEEIEAIVAKMNRKGIDFCFVNNEFIPKNVCCGDCDKCGLVENESKSIDELIKNYDELCAIAESMSEDNPFKIIAESIVESLGKMMDEVKEARESDSSCIDKLEIDAKEAIENIIANLHEGNMNEKEKESVVDALKVLVELGKMYE